MPADAMSAYAAMLFEMPLFAVEPRHMLLIRYA